MRGNGRLFVTWQARVVRGKLAERKCRRVERTLAVVHTDIERQRPRSLLDLQNASRLRVVMRCGDFGLGR
jgi:hypothetical protein